MKRVKTSFAAEKDRLAQPVYDATGQLMYDKGTFMTVFVRARIMMEGHEIVDVYEDDIEYQIDAVIRPDFQQKTIQQLRHLSSISEMNDSGPEEIGLNIIRAMMGSVVEDFFNEKAIMKKVLEMRKVQEYLYQHSVGTMIVSLLLGTSLGLKREELRKLGLAAMLHDVGMLLVPAHILAKEKLDPKEYQMIQNHCRLGYRFLKENTQLEETILLPVLQHQERWDGTGYPEGLSGEEISLFGQIIGLADVFNSMISDRVYRKAHPVSEVFEYIMGDGGLQFNPRLVKEFIKNINPYPLNSLVEMNDGSLGVVEKTNSPFHTRPVVKMVKGPLKGREVDLLKQRNLVILRSVSNPQGSS
ncbi:HD-GYP domain-containing protein [Anoxynatronum buryatiense]|uniref:Metal dependent phosphohydrolase n=1 Tax=Anoxynatronum buryatiense TaxID=489973 RepID=A0AA45WXK8_9CLOT|nr:HD-GYP domain-containing protein [Anoxynatronum buryatiense]SMP64840.1 metal dependent phosphohydrolase [Anoxynatronum buryatiense]